MTMCLPSRKRQVMIGQVLIADQVVLHCLTDCLASKQGSGCVPLTDIDINIRT